jgi:putative transposase
MFPLPPRSDVVNPEYSSVVTRRLHRFYGSGHLHFITCSCHGRQPWLGSPRRRDWFLKVLEEVRQKYQFVMVGYVIMPEHFQLLMSEPETGTPSNALLVLKQRFGHQVLKELRRRRHPAQARLWEEEEHVWQRRFYDFHGGSEKKRIEKLRYMHRNPVKRGLGLEPGQWAWSSFRWDESGEPGAVKLNQWRTAEMKCPAA